MGTRCNAHSKHLMKKNLKKSAMALAATALVGAMAVGGSMAYLTNQADEKQNNFKIGKVAITLTEDSWEEPSIPVVPNEEVDKDPVVTNSGESDAVVFITLDVPAKNITLVQDDGTKGTKEVRDLFWFKKDTDDITTHADSFNTSADGWIKLDDLSEASTVDGTPSHYVYAYQKKLAKTEAAPALFDKVQLKNFIENEVMEDQKIVVNAYAIQADHIIDSGAEVNVSGATISKDDLVTIFNTYATQNDLD